MMMTIAFILELAGGDGDKKETPGDDEEDPEVSFE